MLLAEEVLKQCEFALGCLESEDDDRKFRLFWFAAVTGLRSIGHVLAKVDGAENEHVAAAVAAAFARWKGDRAAHNIFWEFIEDERNALLKEARPSVHPVTYRLEALGETHEVAFEVFAPMISGPYFGEDCRDVLAEAIAWWQEQIEDIKRATET